MQLSLFLLSAAAMVSAATAEPELEVNLGTAGNYAVLAKTGISTTAGPITGDIGVSPIAATAMTGFDLEQDSTKTFSESPLVTGKAYASDYFTPIPAALSTAVSNMETAYTDAAGRPNADDARINLLGGLFNEATTLTAGVYTFGSDVMINADITFDAKDVDGAVFIVQISKNLKQAAKTKVTLKGGAKAKNIFWQVAGTVEVGATSTMEGILLVKTKVDFLANAIMNGRVLTQTACNLLNKATITQPPAEPERRSLRGNTN
jgi:hypothetical protein